MRSGQSFEVFGVACQHMSASGENGFRDDQGVDRGV